MKSSAQRDACEGSTQHSVAQSSEYPLQLRFICAVEWASAGEASLATGLEAVRIPPAEACLATASQVETYSALVAIIVAKAFITTVAMHAANLNIGQAKRESLCSAS